MSLEDNHVVNKSMKTCRYCAKQVSQKRFENHYKYCLKALRECEFCEEIFHVEGDIEHSKNCDGYMNSKTDKSGAIYKSASTIYPNLQECDIETAEKSDCVEETLVVLKEDDLETAESNSAEKSLVVFKYDDLGNAEKSNNVEKALRVTNNDSMLQDLEKIIRSLRFLSMTNEEDFTRSCQEWVKHRKNTLSVLEEVQKELDALHMTVSTAQVVGAGVGVIGGLAALIGFGLQLSGDKEMKEMADGLVTYGGGAGALGVVAAGAACTAEGMLSQSILNKLKEALHKDKMYTKRFLPCFQTSQEVEQLFEKVFGCSFLSDTMRDFFNIVEESKIIADRGGKLIVELADDLSQRGYQLICDIRDGRSSPDHIKRNLLQANDKIGFLLQQFYEDRHVREAISSIYGIVSRSPLRRVAKVGIRVSLKMAVTDMFMPSASGVLIQAASKVADGLFLAITLAINVMNILIGAKNIIEGKSKYAKMLNDIKKNLSTELRILFEESPAAALNELENNKCRFLNYN